MDPNVHPSPNFNSILPNVSRVDEASTPLRDGCVLTQGCHHAPWWSASHILQWHASDALCQRLLLHPSWWSAPHIFTSARPVPYANNCHYANLYLCLIVAPRLFKPLECAGHLECSHHKANMPLPQLFLSHATWFGLRCSLPKQPQLLPNFIQLFLSQAFCLLARAPTRLQHLLSTCNRAQVNSFNFHLFVWSQSFIMTTWRTREGMPNTSLKPIFIFRIHKITLW